MTISIEQLNEEKALLQADFDKMNSQINKVTNGHGIVCRSASLEDEILTVKPITCWISVPNKWVYGA